MGKVYTIINFVTSVEIEREKHNLKSLNRRKHRRVARPERGEITK